MMDLVKKGLRLLLDHKLKVLLMLVSASAFIFFLFPFNDLADLVSSQVSKMTDNRTYLQFEEMDISLIPNLGLSLNDVHVEQMGLPPLKAQEIILSPSLSALISQKPAGKAIARGLFQGDLEISFKPGKKSENNVERHQISINTKNISLNEISRLPLNRGRPIAFSFMGSMDLETEATVDLTFTEQPEADVNLRIQELNIPAQAFEAGMGPYEFSGLKLKNLEVKGRLSGGQLIIENGKIGKSGDEIVGSIDKGSMAMSYNPGLGLSMGAYSFEVKLDVKKTFAEKEKLLFIMLENCKKPVDDSFVFNCRLTGSPTSPLPAVTPR